MNGDPKHVQHCAQSILGNVPSLHMHPKNWAGFEPVSIFLMAGARSEFETGFEQVSGQSSRTTVHTVVVKKFLSAEKHASLFRTLGFFEHNWRRPMLRHKFEVFQVFHSEQKLSPTHSKLVCFICWLFFNDNCLSQVFFDVNLISLTLKLKFGITNLPPQLKIFTLRCTKNEKLSIQTNGHFKVQTFI